MDVRLLTPSDYKETLVKWWDEWPNWIAPPQHTLPDNGSGGLMVSSNGRDICAGFIYTTNSTLGWIEYIVSDMSYKENDRGEAIELLISSLEKMASEKGCVAVFTSVKNQPLINRYKKAGFITSAENTCEMIKKVI